MVVPSSAVTVTVAFPGSAVACVMTGSEAFVSFFVAATVGIVVVPAGNSTS